MPDHGRDAGDLSSRARFADRAAAFLLAHIGAAGVEPSPLVGGIGDLASAAAALPGDGQRAAAERFVAMAGEWLHHSRTTGQLDPVGYERLVDQLDSVVGWSAQPPVETARPAPDQDRAPAGCRS